MKSLVIDVSVWDGNVDFTRWRDQHGLWAVICKCGGNEGGRYTDRTFAEHYDAAKAAGLHVGAYYYTTTTDPDEAAGDARHCLEIIGGRSMDMPIYIDVEDPSQGNVGARRLTDVCLAFMREIENAGHRGGVYMMGSWWTGKVHADELRPYANWIAWWTGERPSAISDVGMWQFGSKRLSDGDVAFDDVGGYTDANYCYVDYPSQRKSGGDRTVIDENLAQRVVNAAYSQIGEDYYSMNYGASNGFGGMGTNYVGRGWGCAELASFCYNTTAGTSYVGSCWNFAGDALAQGVNQGGSQFRFVSESEAHQGDVVLYIQPGHNGMDYADYGHAALYVGNGRVIGARGIGKPGEYGYLNIGVQETYISTQSLGGGWRYLRCGHLEKKEAPKVTPKQPKTDPKNNYGLKYRAHVQGAGWMPSVHDGQTAGSEGYGARMEALKITPPADMVLDAYVHVQGIGNLYFDGIKKGKSSGEGSSQTDPIIGTVGQSRRMEALRLVVIKWPESLKGKKLCYQGHVQGIGWDKVCHEGEWCGTRGKKKRLEAVRIWFE